jgi:hypothetical protein
LVGNLLLLPGDLEGQDYGVDKVWVILRWGQVPELDIIEEILVAECVSWLIEAVVLEER